MLAAIPILGGKGRESEKEREREREEKKEKEREKEREREDKRERRREKKTFFFPPDMQIEFRLFRLPDKTAMARKSVGCQRKKKEEGEKRKKIK